MAKVSMLARFFLLQKCVDYLSVLVGFEENGKAIFMKSPPGRPAHFRPLDLLVAHPDVPPPLKILYAVVLPALLQGRILRRALKGD